MPGFGLFTKAKKALDDVAANMMGDKWLTEVKTEEGQWKDLEGWTDQYEPKPKKKEEAPKKEDSEAVKTAKNKAKTAAIEMGFKTMHETIVFEIMNVLLESSSKVIGATHDITLKDTENPRRDQVLPLLAALNVVILSYRFDKTGTGDTNKFKFIRKQACADMTNVAYELYANDKKPTDLVEELKTAFGDDRKSTMRAILMEKMDELVKGMAAKAGEKGNAEKMDKAANILGGTGGDNVLLQFLSFFAVSKLEVVRGHLLAILEEFMATLDEEMSGDKKSKEEVQEGMVAFADSKYQTAKSKVEAEVATYTDAAKAMLLAGGPSATVEEANA